MEDKTRILSKLSLRNKVRCVGPLMIMMLFKGVERRGT